MGEVYRARDERLQRAVAIKVLPLASSGDAERRERFRREALALSRLSHPNICAIHDIGSENGLDYLVMELLDGKRWPNRARTMPASSCSGCANGPPTALRRACHAPVGGPL